MSRMDLVTYLLPIARFKLSKEEKKLLENNLFILVYREVCEIFKHKYKEFIRLIPFYYHQENDMFGPNFIQEMIKDILSTEEYSLTGIATHTQIPEEVLSDVLYGINTNPSFDLSRKLVELHILVRRDLYNKVLNKVVAMIYQSQPAKDEKIKE